MKPSLVLLTALLVVAPVAGAPDADDAYGAILCLTGEMTGTSGGGECSRYIERYFSIIERHHGDFSPSRTARKRMGFLEQCPSGESDTRNQVNDRYGTRRGL